MARRWVQVLSAVLIVSGAGCGSREERLYPTTGSVTVDGSPAQGVVVVLYPENPGNKSRPSGVTDEHGVFELMTRAANDGAPAGKYRVALRWPAEPEPAAAVANPKFLSMGTAENKAEPIDRLGGRYWKAESSGLTCEIEAGENLLDQFTVVDGSQKQVPTRRDE